MEEKPLQHKTETAPCRVARSGETDHEYHCPVCHAVIPSEEVGRKVWCKKCGYLESCCNPV